MIITRMSGGLGNQLFQYAIGRHLSIAHQTELLVEISHYLDQTGMTPRVFTLSNYNIAARIATESDLRAIGVPDMTGMKTINKARRYLFRLFERLKSAKKRKLILEKNYRFDKSVLGSGNPCYLNGNWQSAKYFEPSASIIRNEITLKNSFSQEAEMVKSQINSSNSISLHVRRGDYAEKQRANALHGVCSMEYYQHAIAYIAEREPDITIFVFSDDIEWVKKNLHTPHPIVYVSNSAIPDYQELVLMSQCKHHIIANSTFSWWGAWLNPSPAKIVVAPKHWFASNQVDASDLIPESWVRIT